MSRAFDPVWQPGRGLRPNPEARPIYIMPFIIIVDLFLNISQVPTGPHVYSAPR